MIEKDKERLFDLLADRALFGLSEAETAELDRLEKLYPEAAQDDSFDLTAAALNLSVLENIEPLPDNLRDKILSQSTTRFETEKKPSNVINFQPKLREVARDGENVSSEKTSFAVPFRHKLGWVLAAAACVALAFLLLTRPAPQPEIVKVPPAPQPEILTFAQERERLLAQSPDAVKAEWTEPNPAKAQGISGDVVWSNSLQKGYLRLRGFPKNDAAKETYQLWIFDANQDEKTPVDGGVFDVNQDGEVIVPIDAKLKIVNPKMFAVTAEKPGGVVVSKREKLLSIAKVSA